MALQERSRVANHSTLLKRFPHLRHVCLILCKISVMGLYRKRAASRRIEQDRFTDDGCPNEDQP